RLRAQLVAGLTSDEKKGAVDCTAVQAVAAQFVTPAVPFDVVTRDDEGCLAEGAVQANRRNRRHSTRVTVGSPRRVRGSVGTAGDAFQLFQGIQRNVRPIRPPKMTAPSRSGWPRVLDRGGQSRSRFP